MALEREYKFVLDEPPKRRELLTALEGAGLSVEDLGLRQQRDDYYDSPSGALRKTGVALRRRSYGDQRLATFKEAGRVEGGLHAREELELPLEDGDWPEAIRARLAGLAAPGSLEPVVTLKAERQRYKLSAGGKALAELSLDAVEAARGEQRARFFELELEAMDSNHDSAHASVHDSFHDSAHDLADLAGLLLETLPLTVTSLSKLERALMLLEGRHD